MDPLERALANELTHVAATARGWEDPAARVRAAAHRQQQRRVVAGVVAVVAGIVVAAAVVTPAAGTRGAPAADSPLGVSETPVATEEPTPATEPTPTEAASPAEPTPTKTAAPTTEPTQHVVATAEATPARPSTQPTPSRNPSAIPSPSGYLHRAPVGTGMEIGRWYSYDLFTHCGIEYAQFDGRHWRTQRLDDGSNNPPPGWNNPYQSGAVALLDRDLAEFRGNNGKTLWFQPTERTPPMCM